jgi:hypothetical protein
VLNYTELADDTFVSNGSWTLNEKGKTVEASVVSNVQIRKPDDGRRLGADSDTEKWESFNKNVGVGVLDIGFGDKVGGKSTYFLRTAPYEEGGKYYPGTRASKVAPSAIGRAPGSRPNYKANNIKPRAGNAINIRAAGATLDNENWVLYGKAADAGRGIIVLPAKGSEPSILAGGTVVVRAYATARRPVSAPLTIDVATAADALSGDWGITTNDKGRITIDRAHEARALTPDTAKWGKAPKVAAPANGRVDTFLIRVKSDARSAKAAAVDGRGMVMGFTGNAASDIRVISITWTVEGTGKDATVTAAIASSTP